MNVSKTQLIELLADWTSIMERGSRQIDTIVLDFSKAFHVVPYNRLLLKRRMYAIAYKTAR